MSLDELFLRAIITAHENLICQLLEFIHVQMYKNLTSEEFIEEMSSQINGMEFDVKGI